MLLQARCEWDLMKVLYEKLGKAGAAEVIRSHRETHITKAEDGARAQCGCLHYARLRVLCHTNVCQYNFPLSGRLVESTRVYLYRQFLSANSFICQLCDPFLWRGRL